MPAADRLHELLEKVEAARHHQGLRLAKVLHDEVGQVLTAAGLHLSLLEMDLQAGATAREPLLKRVSEIQTILEQALSQVRSLSYEVDPRLVARLGLSNALARIAERYNSAARGSIAVELEVTGVSVRVAGPPAGAIVSVAELAVDNAVRHSGARSVTIGLKQIEESLTLNVIDDGKGFQYRQDDPKPVGLGLPLMAYWAREFSGCLDVQSSAGGTRITLTMPVKAPAAVA